MTIKMGEKIKTLRKKKGFSQETLAQVLGVSFQAVSKWETGMTMPDVALIPAIASFFGVSIDELFEFNVYETERKIEEVCRAAAACRHSDPVKAEQLLREGLKQFPADETMLTLLLYVLLAMPDREEDTITVCRQLLEYTSVEGVKYDVLRILAQTYHSIGKMELVEPVLEQIPEFYFTRTECAARLLTGEKRREAARFQMNLSGRCMVDMLRIMAEGYEETGEMELAAKCRRIAEGVLAVFSREDGQELELPGYQWL